MAYRADFFLNLVISLVFTSMGPIVQYLIFSQSNGYPDWNTDQILLFQGILLFSMGLNSTVFGEVRGTAVTVMMNGDFDRYLIKPYPAIGLLLAGGFTLKNIGSLIAGTAITIYMAVKMDLTPSFSDMLLFVWFISAGVIVYMGLTILFCGLVIVLIQMHRLGGFFDNLLRFAGYPLEVIPRIVPNRFRDAAPARRSCLFTHASIAAPTRLEHGLGKRWHIVDLRTEPEVLEPVYSQVYKRRGVME